MASPSKIGPPANINDNHKHYGVFAGLLILGIVSTIFALSRLWYRASTLVFGADDYATIPAIVRISPVDEI